MSSVIQKYRDLVENLFQSTQTGKIVWAMDEYEDCPYCQINTFKILISSSQDAEGEPIVIIRIVDKEDNEIDSFNDNFLRDESPSIEGFSGYWSLMETLHNMARRKASGADEALDNILSFLNKQKL